MIVWTETADDEVPPPDGMPAQGAVRRRSWRSATEGRRYIELTGYLGLDFAAMLIVRWDCEVWDHGVPMERMYSGTKLYNGYPTMGRPLYAWAKTLSPMEVGRYAVWGEWLAWMTKGWEE